MDSTTAERLTVMISKPCPKEEYVLDDFPEGAEDCPGTWEEIITYPEPKSKHPTEEPEIEVQD